MVYKNFIFVLLLLSACNSEPSGKQIIEKSINFHDPSNQWSRMKQQINIQSDFVYPDSSFYSLTIGLDNPNKMVAYTNNTLVQSVVFTDSTCLVVSGNRTCEQAAWTKNFYHFILGLPMTLENEEGIIQETVLKTTFHNTACYRVEVNFIKEKWHFYFSDVNYQLIGFAFNKNFEHKAEEILTEGLIEIDGLKLNKARSWWITTDSLVPIYSGRDEIKSSSFWL